MDENVTRLLVNLDDELERKCFALKQKRQQATLQRLFVLVCTLMLVVPVALVFVGVNLVTICAPTIIFFAVGLLILSPVLLEKNMEELLS